MKRIGSLALVLGVLLTAGLWANDPDLKRFEKDIARFDEQDKAKPPPTGAVLFTGSSSIARWSDVGKYFPDYPVINRGFGGSTIPEVNHFLDRIVLTHKPRVVVLFCGGNDMAQYQRTPEDVLADFQAFCNRINAKLPDTRIVYLSIHVPPARIKQADKIAKANALIAAECGKNKKLAYIDISSLMLGDNGQPNRELYADSLHPNAKAYELWAAKLRQALK
jgi:lysophospholipase L1-like esterase